MTQILDGKALAGKIREGLKQEVQQLSKSGITPSLTVILVGEDPAKCTCVTKNVQQQK